MGKGRGRMDGCRRLAKGKMGKRTYCLNKHGLPSQIWSSISVLPRQCLGDNFLIFLYFFNSPRLRMFTVYAEFSLHPWNSSKGHPCLPAVIYVDSRFVGRYTITFSEINISAHVTEQQYFRRKRYQQTCNMYRYVSNK